MASIESAAKTAQTEQNNNNKKNHCIVVKTGEVAIYLVK